MMNSIEYYSNLINENNKKLDIIKKDIAVCEFKIKRLRKFEEIKFRYHVFMAENNRYLDSWKTLEEAQESLDDWGAEDTFFEGYIIIDDVLE